MPTNYPSEPAKRLRAIWESKKIEYGFTQNSAAEKMDWTQGAISQYINNLTPMAPATIIKFANFLGVHPLEIDPSMADKLPHITRFDVANPSNGAFVPAESSIYKKTANDTFATKLTSSTLVDNEPLSASLVNSFVELSSNLTTGYSDDDTRAAKPYLFAGPSKTHNGVDLYTINNPIVKEADVSLWRVISIIPMPRQ